VRLAGVAGEQHSQVDAYRPALMNLINSSKEWTISLLGVVMSIAEISIQKSKDHKKSAAPLVSLKRKLTATQKRRAQKKPKPS
jgi:hypothetical protein